MGSRRAKTGSRKKNNMPEKNKDKAGREKKNNKPENKQYKTTERSRRRRKSPRRAKYRKNKKYPAGKNKIISKNIKIRPARTKKKIRPENKIGQPGIFQWLHRLRTSGSIGSAAGVSN